MNFTCSSFFTFCVMACCSLQASIQIDDADVKLITSNLKPHKQLLEKHELQISAHSFHPSNILISSEKTIYTPQPQVNENCDFGSDQWNQDIIHTALLNLQVRLATEFFFPKNCPEYVKNFPDFIPNNNRMRAELHTIHLQTTLQTTNVIPFQKINALRSPSKIAFNATHFSYNPLIVYFNRLEPFDGLTLGTNVIPARESFEDQAAGLNFFSAITQNLRWIRETLESKSLFYPSSPNFFYTLATINPATSLHLEHINLQSAKDSLPVENCSQNFLLPQNSHKLDTNPTHQTILCTYPLILPKVTRKLKHYIDVQSTKVGAKLSNTQMKLPNRDPLETLFHIQHSLSLAHEHHFTTLTNINFHPHTRLQLQKTVSPDNLFLHASSSTANILTLKSCDKTLRTVRTEPESTYLNTLQLKGSSYTIFPSFNFTNNFHLSHDFTPQIAQSKIKQKHLRLHIHKKPFSPFKLSSKKNSNLARQLTNTKHFQPTPEINHKTGLENHLTKQAFSLPLPKFLTNQSLCPDLFIKFVGTYKPSKMNVRKSLTFDPLFGPQTKKEYYTQSNEFFFVPESIAESVPNHMLSTLSALPDAFTTQTVLINMLLKPKPLTLRAFTMPSASNFAFESAQFASRENRICFGMISVPEARDLQVDSLKDEISLSAKAIPLGKGESYAIQIKSNDNSLELGNSNLYFVIDCNSSIESYRMDTFKSAISTAVQRLSDDCKFNVIYLNSDLDHLFDETKKVSTKSKSPHKKILKC